MRCTYDFLKIILRLCCVYRVYLLETLLSSGILMEQRYSYGRRGVMKLNLFGVLYKQFICSLIHNLCIFRTIDYFLYFFFTYNLFMRLLHGTYLETLFIYLKTKHNSEWEAMKWFNYIITQNKIRIVSISGVLFFRKWGGV